MARFSYEAYDASGAPVSGTVEASSQADALEKIHALGQIPFSTMADDSREEKKNRFSFNLSGTLGLAGQAELTRELATLLQANIPIDEALAVIVEGSTRKSISALIASIREIVLAGRSLSDAIADQPDQFDRGFVSIIRAGEASGELPAVLDSLAASLERQLDVRTRLRSALVYPVILLTMACVSVLIIVTVLVPSLEPLFGDGDKAMPFSLRLLSGLGNILSTWWPAVLIGLVCLVLALRWTVRREPVALARDRSLLRLPLAGGMIAKRETARFARTLAILTGAGVPLLEAMRIAGAAVRNRVFAAEITAQTERVMAGARLSEAVSRSAIIPGTARRLIRIGDESGHLGGMLLHIAQIFEDEVARDSERLMTFVTPALTVLIGLLVGGLILSVMGAITSLNSVVL